MASSDLCGAPGMHADKTLKANESEKKRKKKKEIGEPRMETSVVISH